MWRVSGEHLGFFDFWIFQIFGGKISKKTGFQYFSILFNTFCGSSESSYVYELTPFLDTEIEKKKSVGPWGCDTNYLCHTTCGN